MEVNFRTVAEELTVVLYAFTYWLYADEPPIASRTPANNCRSVPFLRDALHLVENPRRYITPSKTTFVGI